ncbi:MAG: recombinase family protein [Flexilinea sp.]|nr:recombinase family protein [Flexilinea sp.]
MNVSPFRKGDKVVGYCRYSEGTEQGLKNQSTEEQADAIRRFCDEQGLVLTRIFADPFASGRSVAKRDHYLEMLSFLLQKKKPDVQGLIVWDWERYGRNFDQAQLDAARLRMAGYKLFSLQQPIADDGPFAHVLEAMYFASAQNQSDMISADVKRALQANFIKYKVVPRSCVPAGWVPVRVEMGQLSDGAPRVGYRFEPDPALIDSIRSAVKLRMEGKPVRDILQMLGKPFTDCNSVLKLFRRPLLYGSFTYGGTTIEDYCEPIISKDEWAKLQVKCDAMRKSPRRDGSGAYSKDRAMLSGLCWCAVCGERVYINRRKSKGKLYETYYCNHKHSNFRKELLDAMVLDASVDILSGDYYERMKARFAETRELPADAAANARIQTQIAAVDKKLETIADAIAVAGPSRTLLLKLKDLETQKEGLLASLEPDAALPLESLLKNIDSLRDYILSIIRDEKSTTEELRDALSLFVQAVFTYPDGMVAIRHTLPGVGCNALGVLPIFGQVGSEMSGLLSAPPEGVEPPTS